MQPSSKSKIWTIPNLLSLVRIALIPAIVWNYLNREDGVLAGCLIVVSGLTDLADGIIARKFHQISDLGRRWTRLPTSSRRAPYCSACSRCSPKWRCRFRCWRSRSCSAE